MMTQPEQCVQTSYDRVPYKSHPFSQTHPDRLATIATLLGLQPPPVATARVLELGCASGGNLLPLAEQLPEGRFLGIDASLRQIDEGRLRLDQTQLTNVELRFQDILEFPLDEPRFDYIVCHGVYSWVPDSVQQKILAICSRNLSPGGVAYVSYNTYPGWRMRGMIRDIMRYRAQFFEAPGEKLAQARRMLTFLTNSVRMENNPYGMMLRSELESLGRADDSYLLHEHLEEINEPLYFHEFAERAARAGLQYLGEADFGAMSIDSFPPPVQGMLHSVSRDTIELEQYMDFVRNRAFRQTLLVHRDASVVRTPAAETLLNLRVASSGQSESETIDLHSREQTVFRRKSASLRTTDPIVRAAFVHLRQIWPASIPFIELASIARSMAVGGPVAVDSDHVSAHSRQLAATLLQCFGTSMADLYCSPRPFVTRISERPLASVVARIQAQHGSHVTNLLHESITLDDLQCQVLRVCDGTRHRDDLIDSICGSAARGEFVMFDAGQKLTEESELRRAVANMLPAVVQSLARRALLIA